MTALSAIFWGIIVFSVLVFIHEGGHYLAARLSGVRVLEFFLGLPGAPSISRKSPKNGTRFGITMALLGGYARIAGMEPGKENPHLALVLTLVNARGQATAQEVAYATGISEIEADDALHILEGWGSIIAAPVAVQPGEKDVPFKVFRTVARSPEGLTLLDGADITAPGSTAEGERYIPDLDPEEFLARERSHTYRGKGFLPRAFMLVAGVVVNLIFAFVLFTAILAIDGISLATNTLDEVVPDSPAAQAGLTVDDTIVELDGVVVSDWTELLAQLSSIEPGTTFPVVYLDGGQESASATTHITMPEEGIPVGIRSRVVTEELTIPEAAAHSGELALMTGRAIIGLFDPAETKQVLDQSMSVVGIAVVAGEAASAGIIPLLTIAAAISLSLGLMNLLPIPPLDGGKLLIEIIQAVMRRPLSARIQNALSLAGIALFLTLFVYMLMQDTVRFVFGG